MHELSLAKDAVRKVERVVWEAGGGRVVRVSVSVGALAAVSAGHLRRHFAEAARGTRAEGARLDLRDEDGVGAPDADALRIDSIEIEPCLPAGRE